MVSCPICKESSLVSCELEPNLQSCQCEKCGGRWIGALQYEQWLATHGDNLPEKAPEEGVHLASGETVGAKFCPECKYVLMKYKIGHNLPFTLNRCAHCGGVWFDKNEWEILKSRNLHDDVHLIFSQSWQAAVRAEEHKATMEQMWLSQLGQADLTEIKRIKSWLEKHPKSAELYAYLLSDKERSGKSVAKSGV